ncbi:MAG: hypothetical protein QW734_10770 [Candidatus Bathyarchaeia archaeon]
MDNYNSSSIFSLNKLLNILIVLSILTTFLGIVALILNHYGHHLYAVYLTYIALIFLFGLFTLFIFTKTTLIRILFREKIKAKIGSRAAEIYNPFLWMILIGIIIGIFTVIHAFIILSISLLEILTSKELPQFFGLFLVTSVIIGFSIVFTSSVVSTVVFTILLRKKLGIKNHMRIIKIDSGKEPLGMVIGTPFINWIFITSKLKDEEELIKTHELGHVMGHHLTKIWFIISLPIGNLVLLFLSNLYKVGILNIFLTSTYTLFLIAFTLFIIRITEIQADLNVYKKLGRDSYDLFLKIFNIDSPRKMPFFSKLTHTSRRDITLTTGDPIAALTHWEIPLVFSLLSADVSLITTYMVLQNINTELSLLLFLASYLSFLMTYFTLSFLLAFIIRPIVSRLTSLTDRGKLNLSLLISSVYLASTSIVLLLFLIDQLTIFITIPMSYVTILLSTWYFIRDKRRSLIIATVSFMIFILVNILILVSRIFVRL